MKLGNETKVTADLTVEPQIKCPCCGSVNYHMVATYDADGVVTGKANFCIECRDNLCKNCDQA